MGRINTTIGLLVALGTLGCNVPYSMEAPTAFKRYRDNGVFKMTTADGVMLQAREEENYPKADLDFWVDAMGRHLEARGYVLKTKRCFENRSRKAACTLDFVLPYGAEDWAFSETIFVEDDTLVLVEVAGPYERFAKVEADLAEALKTFEPNLD